MCLSSYQGFYDRNLFYSSRAPEGLVLNLLKNQGFFEFLDSYQFVLDIVKLKFALPFG